VLTSTFLVLLPTQVRLAAGDAAPSAPALVTGVNATGLGMPPVVGCEAYDAAARRLLDLIDAQEAVLGTNEHFLLGTWLADARAWGADEAEGDYLAIEAKRLLTSWGNEDATGPGRQSRATPGPVCGPYYRSRWALWLGEVRATLDGATTQPVDWYIRADQFNRADITHPDHPAGDTRLAAAAVLDLAVRTVRDA
jgi:alpha-N-acetylglucosaminidase